MTGQYIGVNIADKIIYDFRKKGISYVVRFYGGVALSLLFEYPMQSLFSKKKISLGALDYRYLIHWYNVTYINERAIEIPISISYMYGDILEVGNVLSHYIDVSHDVVDKYEVAAGVINEDIIDYRPAHRYDTILCISTLEHIGFEEDSIDPNKMIRALDHMKFLLEPTGTLVATVPVGWNPLIDSQFIAYFTSTFYFKRISRYVWKQCEWDDIKDSKWGRPYPYANGLVVGVYKKICA
jgi:hypothetical protein